MNTFNSIFCQHLLQKQIDRLVGRDASCFGLLSHEEVIRQGHSVAQSHRLDPVVTVAKKGDPLCSLLFLSFQ